MVLNKCVTRYTYNVSNTLRVSRVHLGTFQLFEQNTLRHVALKVDEQGSVLTSVELSMMIVVSLLSTL